MLSSAASLGLVGAKLDPNYDSRNMLSVIQHLAVAYSMCRYVHVQQPMIECQYPPVLFSHIS